jgi:hypothetical protein
MPACSGFSHLARPRHLPPVVLLYACDRIEFFAMMASHHRITTIAVPARRRHYQLGLLASYQLSAEWSYSTESIFRENNNDG